MKQVVQLDHLGYYDGITEADESPLEPGVYLMPAGTIDVDPPSIPEGQRARWNEGEWVFEDDPSQQPDPEPTYADLRRAEYPDIRDYLDGVVKGDQAQIDRYIADCLAVKAKYPKPNEA